MLSVFNSMNKIACLFLVLVLAVSLFPACSDNYDDAEDRIGCMKNGDPVMVLMCMDIFLSPQSDSRSQDADLFLFCNGIIQER